MHTPHHKTPRTRRTHTIIITYLALITAAATLITFLQH